MTPIIRLTTDTRLRMENVRLGKKKLNMLELVATKAG